jgi:hypothetical protein
MKTQFLKITSLIFTFFALFFFPFKCIAYTQSVSEDYFLKLNNLEIKKELSPYTISSSHRMKKRLDNIFKKTRATQDSTSFEKAGFKTLYVQPNSHIRVASHPLLPGYLVKVYLDSELRTKDDKPSWLWLMYRVRGARELQNLITNKKLSYYTVPKKYLYILPDDPSPPENPDFTKHIAILLVEDMKLVSYAKTVQAWRNKVSYKHLDQLFCIMKEGHASTFIYGNTPLSRNGKFSFIDTEKPRRTHDLTRLIKYFNPEMGAYWNFLIQNPPN